MGILGLESYLLSAHKRACPRVQIGQLVKEYRAETGETEAVAVIDTNILIRQCLEALDVVCGGQFTEYKRNLLEYVHRLEALGITPVFFLDGSIDASKMRCWLDRKAETHQRVEKVYRSVAEGASRSPIPVESCVLPAGMYECTILTLKEAGYKVLCAVGEGDIEIARYARERRCFGVFSRDTDFVILDGARYYLSLFYKHFQRENMSTFLFDRNAISRALHLMPEHLPLLATLLHNDYVDRSYLAPLYSKLLGRRTPELRPDEFYKLEELVPCLVRMVRDELWSSEDPVTLILDRTFNGYPPFLLKNLAKKLGLRDQFEMRDRLRTQLESSLAMHEYAGPQSATAARSSPEPLPETDVEVDVLETAKARHRSTTFLNSAVLSLLMHRAVQMGPSLEDPALPAERTAETALRPFRRRIYGLLEVQGPFTEWVVPSRPPSPGQKLEPCVVEAIRPDPAVLPHPGLLALWRCGEDQDDDDDQWRLLAWALAAHRPPSARVDELAGVLRALPRHLVLPAAIVYLLVHSGALRDLARPAAELARLLTRTCLLARQVPEAQLRALRVARYDRLEVHLAALFMRTFTWVSLLNDVLGAPVPLTQLHPALYFNGALFHHILTDEPFSPDMCVILDASLEDLIVRTACEEAAELYSEE